MEQQVPRIKRVKSIELTGFRGFCGPSRSLDTDGDIVLITGPNGYGKTSLIDALCLLLTGHLYRERYPLVSTINNVQQGILKAKVITDTEPNSLTEIAATVDRTNKIKWEAGPWEHKAPNDQRLAARASFFYQDILQYLFEEDAAEVVLEDFLITTPVSISAISGAVKNSRDKLDNFIMNLSVGDAIPTESEVGERRAQLANSFVFAWESAAKSPHLNNCVDNFPSIPSLTRKDGQMREQWETSFARLAEECSSGLEQESALRGSPMDVLSCLDLILRYLMQISARIDSAIREEQVAQKDIAGFLATIEDTDILLTDTELEHARLRVGKIEEMEQQLASQLDTIYSLERQFMSEAENDVGLVEIVDTLRDKGMQWLDIPKCGPEKLAVPSDVVQWLDRTVKGMDEYEPPVEEQLHSWIKRLTQRRRALEKSRSDVAIKIRSIQESVEASCRVRDFSHQVPKLKSVIEQLKENGVSMVRGRELAMEPQPEVKFKDIPVNPIDKVSESVRAWRKFEQKALEYEKQRRKSKAYTTAWREATELRNALDDEYKQRTSITRNVELIPSDSQEKFGQDVSSILDCFLCVPGIHPVTLERRGTRRPWEIRSEDGRELASFSSGQKAQLAISVILALNAALRDMLWFEIIAFDDFTSALDMNQLPRLATLMRQVAYGVPDHSRDGTELKRQIFIVSHHEDLTNRLTGSLIPPKGRTMRLLNFVGWDPQSGPDIEQFELRAGSSAHEARDRLVDLLEEVWG